MGGTEPVCRAHCNWKMVLAAPCFLQGAPGLHGVAVIVRDDLTTEPPAHFRLVSDHAPFEIVASFDCTAWTSVARVSPWGEWESE